MKQQIDIPNLPAVTVETINVTELQAEILEAVSKAEPLEFYGSEMNGRPGLTAIGVCGALGHSGSVPAVYEALTELHELGLLKRGTTYTDSIYYM